MRKAMSDKGVAALKPRSKRYVIVDPEMRGAYARIQPSGVKSFWVVTRNPNGKQIWTHVGPASIGIKASREIARDVLQRGKKGGADAIIVSVAPEARSTAQRPTSRPRTTGAGNPASAGGSTASAT